MFMSFRSMQAAPAHVADAINATKWITEKLNADHGGQFTVSINFAGDPTAITVSAPWQTLGEYQQLRAAMAADLELGAATRMITSLLAGPPQDALVQVLKPPAEPKPIAQVMQSRVHMPRMADAIAFALDAAEMVDAKTGNTTALVAARTGDRSAIAWITGHDSLDVYTATMNEIEADPDYHQLFKSSEGLMVDGSLIESLWEVV